MKHLKRNEDGVTLVELLVSLTVFMVIIIGFFALFNSLVHSAIIAKQQAVASTLATNQMEYLKSLPYDSLAVAGGSIYSASPLPATSTSKVDGVTYTVKTSINYVDDAYDGCASYPTQALKQLYCRSYPPPSSAPATDTNPQDYKVVHVLTTNSSGLKLAEVDTQISARVSETASTTGALFVNVIDENGDPVSGATVNVANTTTSPVINLSDSSDGNGVAIFYGLPPDTNNFDYKITASKTNYSTLSTIVPSGSLQPTYPNQKILTQQSSYVSLTIKQQGPNSLVIETTDTSGNPLASTKVYAKGGYKKYTSTADTAYYYDNMTPSDSRPTTDVAGLASLTGLVPGGYIFCGDTGATSCTVGGTTYYLAAAVPYGGTSPFQPAVVPTFDSGSPPSTTFAYGATNYYQKVRLMLTPFSNHPRVYGMTPYDASVASGNLANFNFALTGANLPCSASAASCSTTVSVKQGSNTFPASCTGAAAGVQLSCTVNLSSASPGNTQLVVTANGRTLTTPAAPLIGGIVVSP